MGNLPSERLKAAAVADWLRDLNLASKTKRNLKALMRRLFEKAMLWELIDLERNPNALCTGLICSRGRLGAIRAEELPRRDWSVPNLALMVYIQFGRTYLL